MGSCFLEIIMICLLRISSCIVHCKLCVMEYEAKLGVRLTECVGEVYMAIR